MNLKTIKRLTVTTLAATAIFGATATTTEARVLGTANVVVGDYGEFAKYVPPGQVVMVQLGQPVWGADCVLTSTRYEAHRWARADPNRKWVVWVSNGYAACNRGGKW